MSFALSTPGGRGGREGGEARRSRTFSLYISTIDTDTLTVASPLSSFSSFRRKSSARARGFTPAVEGRSSVEEEDEEEEEGASSPPSTTSSIASSSTPPPFITTLSAAAAAAAAAGTTFPPPVPSIVNVLPLRKMKERILEEGGNRRREGRREKIRCEYPFPHRLSRRHLNHEPPSPPPSLPTKTNLPARLTERQYTSLIAIHRARHQRLYLRPDGGLVVLRPKHRVQLEDFDGGRGSHAVRADADLRVGGEGETAGERGGEKGG